MPASRQIALTVLLLSAPAWAAAHQAPSGWSYDNWCCGGQDCQPIPAENVSVTRDGFLVSIPEGSHMTARRAMTKLFGYDEVQESGDGEYHACVLPTSQEFRCLYAPRLGY
jgi:PAS domain-containing protein